MYDLEVLRRPMYVHSLRGDSHSRYQWKATTQYVQSALIQAHFFVCYCFSTNFSCYHRILKVCSSRSFGLSRELYDHTVKVLINSNRSLSEIDHTPSSKTPTASILSPRTALEAHKSVLLSSNNLSDCSNPQRASFDDSLRRSMFHCPVLILPRSSHSRIFDGRCSLIALYAPQTLS